VSEGKRSFLLGAVAGLMLISTAAVAKGPSTNDNPGDKNPLVQTPKGVAKPVVSTKPVGPGVLPDPLVIKLEQLSSRAQFNALADDTLLEVGGRTIRKADFVADFKRRAASGLVGVAHRPNGLSAIQARLAAEEDAAIAGSADEVRRSLAEIKAKGGAR
jgi:hypothetical protein